jgi:GT2 family glycosyltransferase
VANVAIVVLNWNGQRWLRRSLAAALAQPDAEVWLVDNASTDASLEIVRAEFPAVRVLALSANLGYGEANNRAVAAVEAATPFVAFLNNDTVVAPDWLAHLRGTLETCSDCAAAGSKLLQMDRPDIVNHAGGRLTPLGAAFDVGFGAPDDGRFDRESPTGCATGAAMLVRREAFLSVGGFDPRYFAYFDDADLCWRLWLAGHTVRYSPRARVLHAYGGSVDGGRLAPFRIEHCQTNRLQNMVKHLERRSLLAMLPVSFGYDGGRVVQLLRNGQVASVRALVRGWRRFGRVLPAALVERRRIQGRRQRTDGELLRVGALASVREAAAEWRRLGGLAL